MVVVVVHDNSFIIYQPPALSRAPGGTRSSPAYFFEHPSFLLFPTHSSFFVRPARVVSLPTPQRRSRHGPKGPAPACPPGRRCPRRSAAAASSGGIPSP